MKPKRRFRILVSLTLLTFVVSCSFGAASIIPQTHFAYPNSNVVPLGHAEGKASKLCGIFFITWGSPDGDLAMRAVQKALASKGGDLMIDARFDSKSFFIPYIVTICSVSVSGTAAKMEVGRQELK